MDPAVESKTDSREADDVVSQDGVIVKDLADDEIVSGKQHSSNGVDGEVDLSARVRKPTVVYLEWQLAKCEASFKRSMSAWRRQASKIQCLLGDSKDVSLLRHERDVLRDLMSGIVRDYEVLDETLTHLGKSGAAYERFEQIEVDNLEIAKTIAQCLRDIEIEASSHSQRSGQSGRSNRSRSNRSQLTCASDSKLADAAVDAAMLKAKLEYIDAETKVKLELKSKKCELERIQTQRELTAAEAKLRALTEADPERRDTPSLGNLPDHRKDYVDEYCKSQFHITDNVADNAETANSPDAGRNVNATEFVPAPTRDSSSAHALNEQARPVRYSAEQESTNSDSLVSGSTRSESTDLHDSPASSSPQHDFTNFAKTVAEQISLGRLPPPEPGIFTGDPLAYPSWKCAFETLIEQKGIPSSERIYYLKRYIGGAAKEAVEGYFLLATEDAFEEAKSVLQERYGDPFLVASAFRNKLDLWPKVMPRDGAALRKLADFLRQCQTAMRSIDSLNVLNDDRENQKILCKLPDWLVLRWNRVVDDWKTRRQKFPLFADFVAFMVKEANIACHPVTSAQALRAADKQNSVSRPTHDIEKKRSYGARTFSTKLGDRDQERDNRVPRPCYQCKRDHHLDKCELFLSKPVEERKEYVRNEGLCFGCLNEGHRSKFCRKRLWCTVCAKPHPTSLHGDKKPEQQIQVKDSPKESELPKTMNSASGMSHMSDTGNCGKCSMIVPVWVSHQDCPTTERLVYALLDTQSDTTFILNNTCERLGIEGQPVKLSLSTMAAKDQLVESCRIEGLSVRGYDSELTISLPIAYSREVMPADRSHIPTPDIAKKWPHLAKIADQLLPLQDVEVGLLIGYNCSRALVPRDVITPVGDEPYGQRTDLGWGIVGIIDPDYANCDGDAIGLSHRILAMESSGIDNSKCELSVKSVVKEEIDPVTVVPRMELDFCELQNCGENISQNDQMCRTEDREVKVEATEVSSVDQGFELGRLARFSDWFRAKRAVANCLKFKDILKERVACGDGATVFCEPVDTASLQTAEREIVRHVQREAFAEDIEVLQKLGHTAGETKPVSARRTLTGASALFRLDPFLDSDGILRVGGRLGQSSLPFGIKHPVILPRRHHISTLVVRYFHEKTGHAGRGITVNAIRENGFWIIGLSSAVTYLISQCVVCKKLHSPPQEQKMSDLPEDRTEPAPPFSFCAVDCFGPWYVKEGRKQLKRYGALFTCMALRAVHIETLNSMDTSSFINALRRFISIRGPVRQLRSDCGTNFVGADTELQKAFDEMEHSRVREFLLKESCDYIVFKRNVPKASHMGGVWERQIRTVRRVLTGLLRESGSQLDDEGLRTLMCEAGAIVNSRPLTYQNLNDATSPAPLTPNQLLTMKSDVILPPPGQFKSVDMYARSRWRRIQYMANQFWYRWRREYLQSLQLRRKWNKESRDMSVGDIVLVMEEDVPRSTWRLARVHETFLDDDKHVRKVRLALGSSQLDVKGKRTSPVTFLDRPIQKLVLLQEYS